MGIKTRTRKDKITPSNKKTRKMVGGAISKTLNVIVDKDTKDVVKTIEHNVETDSSKKNYYNSRGMLPKDKDDFTLDKLKEAIGEAIDEVNYEYNPPDQTKMEIKTYYTNVDTNADIINENIVFAKFRSCLTENRVAFADILVATPVTPVTPVTMTAAELKADPDDLTFVTPTYKIPGTPPKTNYDDVVDLLQKYYDTIIEILKETTNNQIKAISYLASQTIDETQVNAWSAKELSILEDPTNLENALYVIGQVFNIIDPKFYGKLITTPVPIVPIVSTAKIQPIAMFNLIAQTARKRIDYGNNEFYVGDVDANGKKTGINGLYRYSNGNFFEGEFANDVIQTGIFTDMKSSSFVKYDITTTDSGITYQATIQGTTGTGTGTFDAVAGTVP